MTDFVEECRREWKRLRVPDPLANEMASDLAADLRDAEADGTSAEEMLGTAAFDPRTFAQSWARERGLIRSRLTDHLRNRTTVLVGAALGAAIAVAIALLLVLGRANSRAPVAPPTVTSATTTVASTISVPNLTGLTQPEAIARAHALGIAVSIVYAHSERARGLVLDEQPSAGTTVSRGSTLELRVSR